MEEPFLILLIVFSVMLRSLNLFVQKGLVNRALGYVKDMSCEENHSPFDQMQHVIMVCFEEYSHSAYEVCGFV